MSEIIDDTTEISIAAHSTISLEVAFNGSLQSGGDFMGPVVGAAACTRLNEFVDVSNFSPSFVSRDGNGLTSRTIYHFKVTNHNSFHASFFLGFLVDG